MQDIWSRIDPQEAETVQRHMAEVPVRVGALADALGLTVLKSPLPPKISGLIKPAAGGGYEIRVNKYESVERQRFTLAHEIAHFLIHKSDIRAGVVDSILYRSALTSRKEAEANRLAAEILMPREAVDEKLSELGGFADDETVSSLARHFKVSEPAMRIRSGAD
jgi:hypothetical protein